MTAPAQFDQGRVSIANGENIVFARWEQHHSNSSAQIETGSRLEHQISNAVSRCILHNVGSNVIFYEVISGTPQENESIEGGGTSSFTSGTATGGTTTTLIDTGNSWTDDEHNNRWLVVRIGTATEEWRKITDTIDSSDTLTFSPALTVGVSSSDPYEVRTPRTIQAQNFGLGTPIDWVAEGIQTGEAFGVPFEPYFLAIQSVAATQLTLVVNWAGVDYDATTYFVQRGYTTRGYPTIRPNEAAAAALVTAALELIDADISTLFAAPGYEGMTIDVDTDQVITSHASPTVIDFDNERADDSNGKLTFVAGSSHIVIGTGVTMIRLHWSFKTDIAQEYTVRVLVNGLETTPALKAKILAQDMPRGDTVKINVVATDLITMDIQATDGSPTNYTIDNVDKQTFMELEILE